MSLAEAAIELGLAPNSVRSRFKAGKMRGERDNQGKLWVWLEPLPKKPEGSNTDLSNLSVEGKNSLRSKPSNDPIRNAHIEAIEAHLRTVTNQLEQAQSEVTTLRVRASVADRLEAEVTGLEILRDEIRNDRDHWRELAERLLAERQATPEVRRSFWARLFGRA